MVSQPASNTTACTVRYTAVEYLGYWIISSSPFFWGWQGDVKVFYCYYQEA